MQKKRLNKKNILTIPNLLSLIRILLIPFIIRLYCVDMAYTQAVMLIAVSALTDLMDGRIARRFNMVSDVGKILDPVADKLTQASLVICLISRYPQMWGLLALFAVKEGMMLLWGYLTLKHTDTVNSAKWYGKLSTVVLYAVMMTLMLLIHIPVSAANGLMLLCAGVMLLSLVMYARFYNAILRQSPAGGAYQKALRAIRTVFLALIWGAIIIACLTHLDAFSAEGIANFTPEDPWLAAVVMLALFALKSLSVVVYCGLLYGASGILFPLPVAIAVNMLGSLIMVSIPYLIGRRAGASAVEAIRIRYPRTERLYAQRQKNDFFFSFAARMAGLPCDVVSLYIGAINVGYAKYLSGSLLGLLPPMVTFPVMGMSVQDVGSPEFMIALGVEAGYLLLSALILALRRRKASPQDAINTNDIS